MESLPQLVPLIILIPAIGALINFVWGHRLGEGISSAVGITASVLAFIVAVIMFNYVSAGANTGVVVDPPILSTWIKIDSVGLEIPFQFRVDTLSVTMMLVVTGVGSLIHIYSKGYMHGDPKFARFFAFLNLFMMFMLILVVANNYLMMFIGWEGVGLASFLLIGFWWDNPGEDGWQKSNAAKKAFITNRVGDFGIIIAILLMLWTFGTVDYYKPAETANVHYGESHGEAEEDTHGEEVAADDSHGEEAVADDHSEETVVEDDHGEAAADDHGEEAVVYFSYQDDVDDGDLGVFGQTERFVEEGGKVVRVGSLEVPFETMLVIIGLLLLLGAAGKSAQIPLFVWLPDAMAGPTPVSALMHAATMVTAGVYVLVRSNVFINHASEVSLIITIVGSVTALVAGFMAMGQWDIKRVLAYSTVSQLGFMVAAVGLGAYVAAIFHLVTHAFFKATLFLGSGSVIHGVEHGHHHVHAHSGDDHHDDDFDPQDMRNMGGLAKRMPLTFVAYFVATLALAGIFPLAGFWSKDEILADAFLLSGEGDPRGLIALVLLVVAAFFTAFYMGRQLWLVFFGEPRSRAARHAPESAASMTLPILVLAFLSIVGGFINIPSGFLPFLFNGQEHRFQDFLSQVIDAHAVDFNLILAAGATLLALVGLWLGRRIYGEDKGVVESDTDPLGIDTLQTGGMRSVFNLANARLYWDEIYDTFILTPFKRLGNFFAHTLDWAFWHDFFHDTIIKGGFDGIASLLSTPIDQWLIDGTVNTIGRVTQFFSGRLRTLQTGYVRSYAVVLVLGVIAVLLLMIVPILQAGS